MRFHLKQYLIRKHQVIREGVVRAGKQNLLDTIYVEPKISTCAYGGVDPSHEFRQHCQTHLQVSSAGTFVSVKNLFRLQKNDGSLVRTVVTTGIPGIGMSVSVGKFSLDWAELRANKVRFNKKTHVQWQSSYKYIDANGTQSQRPFSEYSEAASNLKYRVLCI